MAVTTSVLWDFITALLAKFRADPTLTGATYNVLIVDGPLLLEASRPNTLFVGGTPGDKDMGIPDGTFGQDWSELGARRRAEELAVACELWCRAGDPNLAQRRADAKAILAAIETALRTDYTLGLFPLKWCGVISGQMFQGQTQQGSTLRLPFTIAAKAQLASQ